MQTKQSVLAWDNLVCAIQNLRAKADSRQPITSPPDSLHSINQLARCRLGDDTFAILTERWKEGDRALATCKKGELDASGKAFDYALHRLNNLTGEARQLAEVFFYPKLAYRYYRMGQFAKAEDSVARTMYLDDELQNTYPAFHGHKLHMLQNKSRMLAVRKQYDCAASLILDIMHYMISPQHRAYRTGDWGALHLGRYACIQSIPVTFEFKFFDFCRDCLRFPAFETSTIMKSELFIKSLKKVASQHDVYRMALDWFSIKRALHVRGSGVLFLHQSTTFLNEYSERYDLFKLLLLMDATRIAKLLDQYIAKQAIDSFISEYYGIRLVG